MYGTRFILKGCPRCNGDLFLDADLYGSYWNCAQCGYMRELHSPEQPGLEEPIRPATHPQKKVVGAAASP